MKKTEKMYLESIKTSSYKESTGIASVVYLNKEKNSFAKDLMGGQVYFALSIEEIGDGLFVTSDYKTSTGEAITFDIIKNTLHAFNEEHQIVGDIIVNLNTEKLSAHSIQSLKDTMVDIDSITVLYDAKESIYYYDDIFRFEDGNNKVKGIHLEGRDTLILVREIMRD